MAGWIEQETQAWRNGTFESVQSPQGDKSSEKWWRETQRERRVGSEGREGNRNSEFRI